MRLSGIWCLAALVASVVAPAAPTVHVKGLDGTWKALPATRQQGRVVVDLTPADAPGGMTTLVINKPDWMVLDDTQPPLLLSVLVGDQPVAVDGALNLGVHDARIPPITVRVADAANPIDPTAAQVRLQNASAQVRVDASSVKPPDTSGLFTVTLSGLAPGVYSGEIVAADMSPQANRLTAPFKIAVFGATIDEDSKSVSLASTEASYRVTPDAKVPITIGGADAQAYVTGQLEGWMYPRAIESARLVLDEPDVKICRVVTGVGDSSGEPIDAPGRYEYDLQVRRDLPCLIVESRLYNDLEDREAYMFWGWLPGAGYETADGPEDWTMTYREIGQVGWIYLPSATEARPGIGWISPLMFGESRFGNMLLYTAPQKAPCKKGDSVQMSFALMPATSAEEVGRVAAKIDELGIWQQR